MKLSYVLQMRDFAILFLAGLAVSVVFSLLTSSQFIRNKIAIKIPMDFIFMLIFAFVFIYLVNYINMGEFRLFLLIAYLIGIAFDLLIMDKLFAKGHKWVYNRLVILYKKIKESFARKRI